MGKKSRSKRIGRDKNTGIKYSTIGFPKILEIRKQKKIMDEGKHPIFKTYKDFINNLMDGMDNMRNQKAILGSNFAEITIFDSLVKREYESIFIESENLADFIESNSINEKDIEPTISVINDFVKLNYEKPYNVFCINLPNRKYSLMICISSTDIIKKSSDIHGKYVIDRDRYKENIFYIGYIRNDGKGDQDIGYSIIEPMILNYTNHEDVSIRKNWRIIVNIFLYMDAFPDCIKSGVPNIYINEEDRMIKSKTISISDAMKEAYSHGPISPHMRRGHFRFLKSDRYKGKRFQTVYVKPTMVKGHAITIS